MMKRKTLTSILTSILVSIGLVLSACNLPGASATNANSMSTAAAQTVQAVLSAEPTRASATTSPNSITSTPTAACQDNAKFTVWTRDNVTYDVDEANQRLSPGEVFNMSWTLQNTGSCTWNNSYNMFFISGTPLTTTTKFPVIPTGQTVAPGGTVKVDIPMSAPDLVGEYNSSFELQNERGGAVITFGVITKVGAASGSLAAPSELRYTYDCSSGSVVIGLTWIDNSSDEDGFRIYRDSALIGETGVGVNVYQDIAPTIGKFKYTVAAFNGSGESPASMNVETKNCQ